MAGKVGPRTRQNKARRAPLSWGHNAARQIALPATDEKSPASADCAGGTHRSCPVAAGGTLTPGAAPGPRATGARERYCGRMRDPEDDDVPPRDDRLGFSSSNFRRKLGEGLAGLLDPDGAIGKGKDLVTGVTAATKNEVVRMVSAEVRQFLDGMDTVELLQQVIAGLVIDVKAEVRFSIDPEGQLKPRIKAEKATQRTREPASAPAPTPAQKPREPAPAPTPTATRPPAKE